MGQIMRLNNFIFICLIFSIFLSERISYADVNPDSISLYMVGNAHIDLAYRWRWNETIDRVGPDTFEGVLKMMDREKGLTFAQSQLALYEQIKFNQPALFDKIKKRIEDGSWSVVGGQWAEPDAILPAGESFIRQFLIGNEFAEKYLGINSIDIAWVPDSFCGQALTLPMLYSGCGIKYYVFGRGAPEDKRIFWWQSPDGSKVLAYKIPKHYNVKIDSQLVEPIVQWTDISGVKDVMVLYGEGDHGGGPREPDIKAFHHFANQKNYPSLKYSTPEQYFKKLNALKKDWPIHKGEIGIGTGENSSALESWQGSYISQARVKKGNRDVENLLLTAEKFATIGSMLQRKPLYPRVDFRELWKVVLRNQFHDILPGTSIGDVFDDTISDYVWAKEEGERLLRSGLEIIGSRIDTRGEGIPLVVYNPVSWKRSDVVDASVRFVMPPDQMKIVGPDDKDVLFQINNWSDDGLIAYITFYANDIPALGYKTFRVIENENSSLESDIQFGPDFVVNKYFKIKWNSDGVTSIFDIKNKRELLKDDANVLSLINETGSSSWDLSLSEFKEKLESIGEPIIIEEGPVQVVLLWQDKSGDSFFNRELVLKSNSEILEFRLTVDWHDHDKLLKVSFPTVVDSGTVFFEQPYGYIERPADGLVRPAQNWIDVSNHNFGIALLNNGKYAFDVDNNVMNISVIRGARDMDPRMDEGINVFDYAIFPHRNSWREGNVTQKALELNQPPIAFQENHHTGELPNWGKMKKNDFSLPAEHSFFSTNTDHVVLSAVKVQQGDWSPDNVVLRLWETKGRDGSVTVTLPANAKKVVEANHIEQVLKSQPIITMLDNTFSFKIGHDQVRTFLVTF